MSHSPSSSSSSSNSSSSKSSAAANCASASCCCGCCTNDAGAATPPPPPPYPRRLAFASSHAVSAAAASAAAETCPAACGDRLAAAADATAGGGCCVPRAPNAQRATFHENSGCWAAPLVEASSCVPGPAPCSMATRCAQLAQHNLRWRRNGGGEDTLEQRRRSRRRQAEMPVPALSGLLDVTKLLRDAQTRRRRSRLQALGAGRGTAPGAHIGAPGQYGRDATRSEQTWIGAKRGCPGGAARCESVGLTTAPVGKRA